MSEFVAHIRETDNARQSVQKHSAGTVKRAGRYAKIFSCMHICVLAALIHDIGKLCADFCAYICKQNDMRRGEIDHCYAGARYIVELLKGSKDKNLRATARFIARVVMSHHGLCDWLDEKGENYFKGRINKQERYKEITNNVRSIIDDDQLMHLLQKAAEEYKKIKSLIVEMTQSDNDDLYIIKRAFYMGQFERLILSVLVDADRTDTADFMLDRQTEKLFATNIWNDFSKNMENLCKQFEQHTDYISQLRNDISNRCLHFADHDVGVCRLVVPTGGGKTYSSLRFAIECCREHHKDRIFYIAPFMSILEQNSDVIKGVVGEDYLLEHYSDMLAEIDDVNELQKYELQTEQWAFPVITTTMVQFLNTLFSGKMASVRRMHRLCNSVIIIDEVQSIPVKCVSLFNLAINFISKIAGASVVLCSATQPSFENTKYRLMLDEQASMTGDYTEDFQTFARNKVVPELCRSGYKYKEAADFCLQKLHTDGSVLFVVNTKKAAAELYKLLAPKQSKDLKIVHLSTNMCPEHRRDTIKNLKNILKSSVQQQTTDQSIHPVKVICITTQLIEAGVDISFPCVIRSLAGMDNLAQAAGRCNRNMEFGQCCNVYLVQLSDENLARLKEIKNAQDVSLQIINNAGYPDLLAVKTMTDYFRKLYQSYEKNSLEMDYQIQDISGPTTILSLLSLNNNRWNMLTRGRGDSRINKQAFKTAGKKFQVIDNNTKQVIVPYNEEAKRLIEDLNSQEGIYDKMPMLRKAQKYSVELYENMWQKLYYSQAIWETAAGVIALKEEYYDKDMGLVQDAASMEFLNV